jgi:V/A-type H+-transporting ATPase subunit E
MGLEQVKAEILQQAKKEASDIAKNAEKEAAKAAKDTGAELIAYEKEKEENFMRIAEVIKRKGIAQMGLDMKKLLLEAKKDAINSVFDAVKRKLHALPAAKKSEMLESVFKKAKKEIDAQLVFCNPRDAPLLKDKGVEVREANISGGIIAENRDSTIRIDLSYEAILENIRHESLQEVSAELFK